MLKTVSRFNQNETVNNLTVNGFLSVSSQGIDFSGNPNAPGATSEVLDDYEEGTWTIELYDAISGGNVSATTVTGYYTKIGNLVTCSFINLNNINTTGMTAGNTLYITLPFTTSSTTAKAIQTGAVNLDTVAFPAGTTQVNSSSTQNAARGPLICSGSAVADTPMTVSAITSGTSDISRYTISYFTD